MKADWGWNAQIVACDSVHQLETVSTVVIAYQLNMNEVPAFS
jgi:hypothetical protein